MTTTQWIGAACALLLGGGAAAVNAQANAQASAPASARVAAQSGAHTDSRWYPWLGCWAPSDSTNAASAVECIAPGPTASAVDAISIAGGSIVERDRLDPSGRPHDLRVDGCDGTESSRWSENGRRVYLHSSYSCGSGITGTSTRLFSLLPSGEWLDVTGVQSGNGSIVTVVRRRQVAVPASAPRAIATALAGRQLAITTARANAASPLTVDDVLEAIHSTSAPTVRAWLVATRQQFNLDSRQIATLTQANVPPSIVRAMLGATTEARSADRTVYGSAASDEYLNTPVYSPGSAGEPLPVYGVSPVMACPTGTCFNGMYDGMAYPPYTGAYNVYPQYVPYPVYTTPLLIQRGRSHFGRPTRPPVGRPVAPAPPPSRTPVGRRPR